MSGYHRASRAMGREAGIKDVAGQLAKLLGTGAEALLAAVKQLGLDGARKLAKVLGEALPGMGRGTRSRFAKAIMSVAMSGGALAATGCAGSVVNIQAGMSYRDYSRQPNVVRVVRHGLPERDVKRIFIHVGGGRPQRRDVREDRHPVRRQFQPVRDVREDRHPVRRQPRKSRPYGG